jgi:hypothetical protein
MRFEHDARAAAGREPQVDVAVRRRPLLAPARRGRPLGSPLTARSSRRSLRGTRAGRLSTSTTRRSWWSRRSGGSSSSRARRVGPARRHAASWPRARSAAPGPVAYASSGTSSVAGATARSRTSARPSRARGASRMTSGPHAACSSSYGLCRRLRGDATSSARARCGTRTRWWPGCSTARGSRRTQSAHPRADARPVGVRASSSPDALRLTPRAPTGAARACPRGRGARGRPRCLRACGGRARAGP